MVVGTCLDCYRGLEKCLFSGQCVEADPKYIPMDRLRRLILRDCPIVNEGPCPRVRTAPVEPCICPTLPATSSRPQSIATVRPLCPATYLPELVACNVSLSECRNALQFSGTTKSGAQSSRQAFQEQVDSLTKQLNEENITRHHLLNQSQQLKDEVKDCQIARGELAGNTTALRGSLIALNRTLNLVQG